MNNKKQLNCDNISQKKIFCGNAIHEFFSSIFHFLSNRMISAINLSVSINHIKFVV